MVRVRKGKRLMAWHMQLAPSRISRMIQIYSYVTSIVWMSHKSHGKPVLSSSTHFLVWSKYSRVEYQRQRIFQKNKSCSKESYVHWGVEMFWKNPKAFSIQVLKIENAAKKSIHHCSPISWIDSCHSSALLACNALYGATWCVYESDY